MIIRISLWIVSVLVKERESCGKRQTLNVIEVVGSTLIPLKHTHESRSWFDDIPWRLSAPWLSLPRVSLIICVRSTITSRDSVVLEGEGRKGRAYLVFFEFIESVRVLQLAHTCAVQCPGNVSSRESIDHRSPPIRYQQWARQPQCVAQSFRS